MLKRIRVAYRLPGLLLSLFVGLICVAVPCPQAVAANDAGNAKQESKPVKATLNLHSIEKKLVEKTNRERAKYGRAPLKIDRTLMKSARRHAAWMARNHRLQHGNAMAAENIATGQHSADSALRSWMNSSGHRANILNSRHRRLGVAAYRSPTGQIYWCQQFRQ